MKDWRSQAHVKWECKFHVVILPKYRKKALYGTLRKGIGRILRDLCRQKGLEIVEGLVGHISGFAVPLYVIDAPGGGGKVRIMPNYLISQSDHRVVLRNYEGLISAYEEPPAYQSHNPATCAFCREKQSEPGQAGVFGLLEGERALLKPQGFDKVHVRSRDVLRDEP